MNKNKQSPNGNTPKRAKSGSGSARVMRVFYILMLLMTVLSLVARIGGGKAAGTARASGGNTARVMVFHHEDGRSCEDLTIAATSTATFSNCGNGIEKQYTLNDVERTQLKSWISTYGAVNYDPKESAQTGVLRTQLYLNGTGGLKADETDIQKMIDFAENLAERMASQS